MLQNPIVPGKERTTTKIESFFVLETKNFLKHYIINKDQFKKHTPKRNRLNRPCRVIPPPPELKPSAKRHIRAANFLAETPSTMPPRTCRIPSPPAGAAAPDTAPSDFHSTRGVANPLASHLNLLLGPLIVLRWPERFPVPSVTRRPRDRELRE